MEDRKKAKRKKGVKYIYTERERVRERGRGERERERERERREKRERERERERETLGHTGSNRVNDKSAVEELTRERNFILNFPSISSFSFLFFFACWLPGRFLKKKYRWRHPKERRRNPPVELFTAQSLTKHAGLLKPSAQVKRKAIFTCTSSLATD